MITENFSPYDPLVEKISYGERILNSYKCCHRYIGLGPKCIIDSNHHVYAFKSISVSDVINFL